MRIARPAKLTAEKVRRIKERLAQGERSRRIAADYHVSYETIRRIARGESWNNGEAR